MNRFARPLRVQWQWSDGWSKSREQTVEQVVADLEGFKEKSATRTVKLVTEWADVQKWEESADGVDAAIASVRGIESRVQEEASHAAQISHQYEGKAHSLLKARWSRDSVTSKWQGGTVSEAITTLEQLKDDTKPGFVVEIKGPMINVGEGKADTFDGALTWLRDESSNAAEQVAIMLAVRFRRAEIKRLSQADACQFPPYLVRPAVPPEYSARCVDCDAAMEKLCQICGLAVCKKHFKLMPTSEGSKAASGVVACGLCTDIADQRARARTASRTERAEEIRRGVPVRSVLDLCDPTAPVEDASDCATCGVEFGTVSGFYFLRHDCCACRRALCAVCMCGSFTCMGTPGKCTHKQNFRQYGSDRTEKVCKDCCDIVDARLAAATAAANFVAVAEKFLEHRSRVMRFLDDPPNFPHYDHPPEYEDSKVSMLKRGSDVAMKGVKSLAPFLPGGWGIGANVVKAVYDYGQYGILGFFMQSEIAESLQVLVSYSSVLQDIPARDLLVGGLYLSVDQRRKMRDDPEMIHREALEHGTPIPRDLLDLLLGYVALGVHSPYQVNAFEAQRFALQQGWRLVTERLSESWLHWPAWCLHVNHEQRIASIAIRGTEVEASCGGDLFTDFNALPEMTFGYDDEQMTAHSGMLASARALEAELRPTLRELVSKDLQITIVGHSLGAGVAALLVWLTKHGRDGEWLTDNGARIFGIGYATPSVMDKASSEKMKPYFVSIVNPVDVVPRLSLASVVNLANELRASARDSKDHFDKDWQDQVDHAMTIWRPRLRTGPALSRGATASEIGESQALADAEGEKQPESRPSEDSLVERTISEELRTIQCNDDSTLEMVPGGVENISRAWYGKPSCRWEEGPGRGLLCTEKVKELLATRRKLLVSPETFEFDPAPKNPKQLLVELITSEIRTLRISENSDLVVPAGASSIVRAWYGVVASPWHVEEGVGQMCTERVKELINAKGKVTISNKLLAVDPAPRKTKVLLVDVLHQVKESELFCPGNVVAIYRVNGALQAALVTCDLPSLRRIIFDKRLFTDHMGSSYHRALLNIRARQDATHPVRWQGFADAGKMCPCCHSDFAWMRTAQSEKQRYAAMTNCRACGVVVCKDCSTLRLSLPEQGILEPARVCDKCVFRPRDGGVAMWRLPQVFSGITASAGQDPDSRAPSTRTC